MLATTNARPAPADDFTARRDALLADLDALRREGSDVLSDGTLGDLAAALVTLEAPASEL